MPCHLVLQFETPYHRTATQDPSPAIPALTFFLLPTTPHPHYYHTANPASLQAGENRAQLLGSLPLILYDHDLLQAETSLQGLTGCWIESGHRIEWFVVRLYKGCDYVCAKGQAI